jgi:two-component system NtrC family sensor kinase
MRRRVSLALPSVSRLASPSWGGRLCLGITAALLGAFEVGSRIFGSWAGPEPVVLVGAVLSTVRGGARAGSYAAGLGLLYAAYHFPLSLPFAGRPFAFGAAVASRLALLAAAAAAVVYMTARRLGRGTPQPRHLDGENAALERQPPGLEAQHEEIARLRGELAWQRDLLAEHRDALAAERRRRFSAFQQLGRAIGSRADRAALLALVAEAVQDLAAARGVAVLLRAAPCDVLEVAAAHGLGTELLGCSVPVPNDAGPRVAAETGVRRLDPASAPDPVREIARRHGVRSVLAAPVPASDDTPDGFLLVFDPEEDAGEAAAALTAAAAQAGAALARLRLERQSAFRARRARLLAAAIEQLQQGLLIAGSDGRVRYANAAAAALHGTDRRALRGLPLRQLYPSVPDTPPHPAEADGWSAEVVYRRPDGSAVPVQLTLVHVRAPSGHLVAAVLIVRDVSDEKRQQAQLMESDRLALVGGLVSAVAHELNNPLAAIANFAELLRSDESDGERIEMLEMILDEAARAGGIVRNLLGFSRPSSTLRRRVRVAEVVQRTVALRIYEQRRRRIDIVLDMQQDMPPVWADPNQLQQVLMNLVINAEQAIGSDGRITIAARARGDVVQVVVEDTGPGIDPEVLPRIFAPFVTTKAEGVGTGLGLAISRSIVEAHGGQIAAENREQGGARFLVELPVTNAVDPDPAASGMGSGAREP